VARGCGEGAPASGEVREEAGDYGEGGGGVGDVELWPGGAERDAGVGRGPGGGGGWASGKKLGSLTASGGRRERPTLCHPSARGYIPRTICRDDS